MPEDLIVSLLVDPGRLKEPRGRGLWDVIGSKKYLYKDEGGVYAALNDVVADYNARGYGLQTFGEMNPGFSHATSGYYLTFRLEANRSTFDNPPPGPLDG